MIFKKFFFISLLLNKILIEINLINIINIIGIIVQIISNFWFSNMFLLFILFLKLKFNIMNKIKNTLIIIIIKKLWIIVILNKFIEFGFWKFKFIHVII